MDRARQPGRPPDRPDRGRAAVHEHHDPVGDERQGLAGELALQLPLDALGGEPERQLAERREVRLGEELVERDLGALRRIDVAVLHPLAERVRAHVDELDLVGAEQDVLRQALVDRRAGDRGDRVGDALEVLDVERADDVDPGVADRLDVLPALGPRRARDVRVGELVDQGDGRIGAR